MRLTSLIALLLLSVSGFTQQYYLFIGTYTQGSAGSGASNGSKGIYVYRFDAAAGSFKPVSTIASDNPSYLALAPQGNFLYAVNETHEGGTGNVSAFAFDKRTGKLTFLDKQTSRGNDPCYVSVDKHRKWVMVANYSGGSYAALPVRTDGSLAPVTQTVQRYGSGPNKARQEKAHVHSTILTPDEKYMVVCDLGTDQLSVLHFDFAAARQPLTPAADSVVRLQPGVGPRHSCFYPGRPFAYVIDELGGAVDAFHYSNGRLSPLQHISSHPAGYKGDIGSADIHIAPGGKFLYVSNRGDANSLAIFSIDSATGRLTSKGFQSTMGRTPRNFMIDPTGRWLLVANQNDNNVVLFRIDPQTGMLTDTGKRIELPSPVCLKMEKAG
jgi:6-phosphogluconolactonase